MLVPYLALTMVDIIVAGSGGIVIVVALFWSNVVPGKPSDNSQPED
jgi:hypothetical protein